MLFTFPSRYWFTIGLPRVFSLGGRARQIHTGFHVPRATQVYATIINIIHKGLSPAMARLSKLFCIMIITDHAYPTTPQRPKPPWFGLIPVRSPLLGESLLFSLPPGTKMFQFPGLASVSKRMTYLQYAGFSHSDTPWSMAVCASHGIFAAYRVLRRLREPRHPPYALVHFCLINTLTSYHTCHKTRTSKASRAENTRTMLLHLCLRKHSSKCLIDCS